jgi:hypothetical protein
MEWIRHLIDTRSSRGRQPASAPYSLHERSLFTCACIVLWSSQQQSTESRRVHRLSKPMTPGFHPGCTRHSRRSPPEVRMDPGRLSRPADPSLPADLAARSDPVVRSRLLHRPARQYPADLVDPVDQQVRARPASRLLLADQPDLRRRPASVRLSTEVALEIAWRWFLLSLGGTPSVYRLVRRSLP